MKKKSLFFHFNKGIVEKLPIVIGSLIFVLCAAFFMRLKIITPIIQQFPDFFGIQIHEIILPLVVISIGAALLLIYGKKPVWILVPYTTLFLLFSWYVIEQDAYFYDKSCSCKIIVTYSTYNIMKGVTFLLSFLSVTFLTSSGINFFRERRGQITMAN